MKNKFHGVTSLILFFIALALAGYVLFTTTQYGWWYVAIVVVGFIAIAGMFCTKCPAAPNNCSHVILGYLTKLFPRREKGSFTSSDYVIAVMIILVILTFPQYWLWKHTYFFIAFWTLLIIAGLEINAYVCRKCANHYCKMCKNKELKS